MTFACKLVDLTPTLTSDTLPGMVGVAIFPMAKVLTIITKQQYQVIATSLMMTWFCGLRRN
jgi:hypothetical protein